MFSLFIVLLRFSSYLATKCLFFNDEPCMATLIDLNSVELKYYPLIISFNKRTGSCNILPPKICASKEKKYINVKVFNIITNKNKNKAMTKHISHISRDFKCKFNSTIFNSNQE